jgi:hypothetical protein
VVGKHLDRNTRLLAEIYCSLQYVFGYILAYSVYIIIIVTQEWVVNGVRRHAEPLGDNDPPQLLSICLVNNKCSSGTIYTL